MSQGNRMMRRVATALAVAAAIGGGTRAQAQTAASSEPMVMFDPSMRPILIDPLAAQMMTGTGIPLTRGEAGLAAAASAQRLTGIGSGRASGVRGVAPGRGGPTAPRRATLGAPGGQASIYFNRFGGGTATNVSAPTSRATTRNFYNRPAGFFPEGRR